ncbi:hypothetical protein IAT38_000991 [Cryptococcus sp. DSM 104549]
MASADSRRVLGSVAGTTTGDRILRLLPLSPLDSAPASGTHGKDAWPVKSLAAKVGTAERPTSSGPRAAGGAGGDRGGAGEEGPASSSSISPRSRSLSTSERSFVTAMAPSREPETRGPLRETLGRRWETSCCGPPAHPPPVCTSVGRGKSGLPSCANIQRSADTLPATPPSPPLADELLYYDAGARWDIVTEYVPLPIHLSVDPTVPFVGDHARRIICLDDPGRSRTPHAGSQCHRYLLSLSQPLAIDAIVASVRDHGRHITYLDRPGGSLTPQAGRQ